MEMERKVNQFFFSLVFANEGINVVRNRYTISAEKIVLRPVGHGHASITHRVIDLGLYVKAPVAD